jgi:hypothetical protein
MSIKGKFMSTISIPQVLLPIDGTDMTAWAVNACDQFTSDEVYWKRVQQLTHGKRSTYNLIYPEIYLKDNTQKRINAINASMQQYLKEGAFYTQEGFILIKRTTQSGVRTGILLAIDLEDYSFEKGAKTLIRSTEATILERIPPRVEIRKNAPIELPHIMILYDDRDNVVLNSVKCGKTLYDFDLNMSGGHISGQHIENSQEVEKAFYSLLDDDKLIEKYGVAEKLLFAVGDGNHSLATAKTCWENIKKTLSLEEQATHPARYAMCEAVNIHDPALKFEPIHRLVKTDKAFEFANGLNFEGTAQANLVVNGAEQPIAFPADVPAGIRQLDEYIAQFIKKNGGEVDYIHGDDQIEELSSLGVGVELPAIQKNDFFRLIITGGNLPRKTFSMGDGNEKRYYIEAKAIR